MQTSKQIINFYLVLMVLVLSGCKPSMVQPLSVQLLWQGQPLQCDQPVQLQDKTLRLANMQLYLSDFRQQQNVPLQESAISTSRAVLLGTDCQHFQQWQIPLAQALSPGDLSFSLGLAPELNHQDPLTAATVFQQSDMFWNWQGGYKFFRLDFTGALDWSLHLGSTGCKSPSVLRPPIAPCLQPNLSKVTIQYTQGQPLKLDLAVLLQDFVLTADNSCMSDPNSLSCQQLIPRLLMPATGLWQ